MNDDTIKRFDAIKELRREYPAMPMFKSLREEWAIKTEGFRKAEEVIMNLPSADRPQGEWVKRTHYTLIAQVNFAYCSECGQPIMHEHTRPLWNFCPNCGAKMKGADDE